MATASSVCLLASWRVEKLTSSFTRNQNKPVLIINGDVTTEFLELSGYLWKSKQLVQEEVSEFWHIFEILAFYVLCVFTLPFTSELLIFHVSWFLHSLQDLTILYHF